MHQDPRAGTVNVNPDPEITLAPGDTILVIAPMEPLLALEAMNNTPASAGHAPAERVGRG
jgi:hypothetical protein